jgi:hypothetical protein
MLNLPHKLPVLFAQEILSQNNEKAVVSVCFPKIPSLAMMMEAAAQSSCALGGQNKEGFVVSCSNIILHVEPKDVIFEAHVSIKLKTGLLNEIFFELRKGDILISSGTLLLLLNG